MLPDNVQRFRPILTIDLDGSIGRNSMRCQECDHITCATGCQIGVSDLLQFLLADSSDRHQPLRLMVEDFQCTLAKCIVDLLCDPWTDTFDLTGRKIRDNALLGMGDDLLVAFYFELKAMLGMLGPMTIQPIPKVFSNGKTVANGFDLTEHVAICVPDDFQRSIDCDHVVNGGGIGNARIE